MVSFVALNRLIHSSSDLFHNQVFLIRRLAASSCCWLELCLGKDLSEGIDILMRIKMRAVQYVGYIRFYEGRRGNETADTK